MGWVFLVGCWVCELGFCWSAGFSWFNCWCVVAWLLDWFGLLGFVGGFCLCCEVELVGCGRSVFLGGLLFVVIAADLILGVIV